nr:SulP family inorganic anion transporter [Alkalibacterium kapii]
MQLSNNNKIKSFNPLKKLIENKKLLKDDFLSGLTVALALIPESIAFTFVAGVSPILSLQTAVMIGFIAAIFSGRPGMISSSTAAISVVFASLIAVHGLEYLDDYSRVRNQRLYSVTGHQRLDLLIHP